MTVIDHVIVVECLEFLFGIEENTLNWVKSYITDRCTQSLRCTTGIRVRENKFPFSNPLLKLCVCVCARDCVCVCVCVCARACVYACASVCLDL